MPLLDVQQLSKRFYIDHLQREIATFDQVSFTLEPGQFFMVTGRNGAGKSSLLRCLYRTYIPTSGRAYYAYAPDRRIDLAAAADVDIAHLRQTSLGMVTQFLRPRPRVTAYDLVAEPLRAQRCAEALIRPQVEAMLTAFGLKSELWHAYPTTFSGGEQQRVNLARALIAPRRLLLLDEPTASLDAAARAFLTQRLAELKAQGVAMIGVFHFPDEVRHLIDGEVHLGGEQPALTEERPHVAD
jgi:alpha-D-ribose 1-methylphosphonate 5-triphosphate synthase subunit PhnL